jgi:hypothetical protein
LVSRSEEPVVSKDTRLIGKTAETEAHAARHELRKEDVKVDEGVDTDGPGLRDKR